MAIAPLHVDSEKVLRLSLGWVLLGVGAVLLVGLAGGFIAQQLFTPPLPPLSDTTDPLRTTVQQVTISPNTAAAELIARTEPSVMALARGNAEEYTIVATGSVVTNDGLIVTAAAVADMAQLAIDREGRIISLAFLGRDALYGFAYYQAQDTVLTPIDVRATDAAVGEELLALSRDTDSFAPRVRPFRIFELAVPEAGNPAGVQRILRGSADHDATFLGSPLVDDAGKIAGVLIEAEDGQALTAAQLKTSLDRMANNQRETNPLATLGLALTYSFTRREAQQPVQFTAEISAVAPNSPAALSTLRAGDTIIRIKDESISWDRNVVEQLGAPLPLIITILRAGNEQQVQLQPVTLSD